MRRVLASPSFHWTHAGKRPLQQPIFSQSTTCIQRFQHGAQARWLSQPALIENEESWPLASRKQQDSRVTEVPTTSSQQQTQKSNGDQQPSAKKLFRQRQNAAKAVPYWLDKDAYCFEQTMNALNLDFFSLSDTTNFRNRNGDSGGVRAEYRQLYKDSIVSFCQQLSSDPSSVSPKMEPALDRLVEVGFADLQWAKHFRRFSKHQQHFRENSNVLQKHNRRHQHRIEKLDRAKKALEETEKRYAEMKQEVRVDHDKPKESSIPVVERMMEAVGSLWKTSDDSSNQEENVVIHEEESGLDLYARKVRRQRRAVQHAQDGVEAAERQLERLKAERDDYKPVMTRAEYDKANPVVQQVLKDISAAFATHIQQRHSRMIEQYQVLDEKTDLTKPHEWYLHARLDRRKIIFHGGPTNSGKTYAALQRLKVAKKGLYLGPLRLLAAEVYESLTSQGIYTSLYTGQEQREVPFATHSAATVEMAPTMEDFDVVVIDEIQMIADPYRGFAWSRALLGIRCKEIHVCGGLEAEEIVRRIADFCGDDLEVQQYERFSELTVADKSISTQPKVLGSYREVRPGDCVVAFSRNDIFAIKREIERNTEHKCCVIYGSLPPETRTDQARLFNDPTSGYDVLVASDAIGMGLNLNIRRIIFNSMFKSNGDDIVKLDHSSVKQISGRAGRRNSPYPNGEVTCRDPNDMNHLQKCMREDIAPIQKAGLLPTSEHIESFSEAIEKYELGKDYDNLHKILVEFEDMAKTQGDFFVCRQAPMRVVAKFLDHLPISISDKYNLCMAPTAVNNRHSMMTLKKFAEKFAAGEAPGISGNPVPKRAKSFSDLSRLCGIHGQLELFLWLSARFPGNAVEQQTAQAMKEEVIKYINEGLSESENLKLDHCYIKHDTKIRSSWKQRRNNEDVVDEFERFDDDYQTSSAEVDDV